MATLEHAWNAKRRSAPSGSRPCHGQRVVSTARRLPIGIGRRGRNLSARLSSMPRERTESSIRTVAFVGNYLPRKCGIATFTSDLLQAVAARLPRSRGFAVPGNDIGGCYHYPDVVRFEIEERDIESYRRAADFLNSSNVDIVSVQHEFGIFGGPAGGHF